MLGLYVFMGSIVVKIFQTFVNKRFIMGTIATKRVTLVKRNITGKTTQLFLILMNTF